VILPDGAAQNAFVLVSGRPPARASDLIQVPSEPRNPTEFQRAQYQHALDKANTTTGRASAAWQAEGPRAIERWQAQVIGQLESEAAMSIHRRGPRLADAVAS